MKRKILNSFIICTIGISFSACNKKELKNEGSFSSYGKKSVVQLTNTDIFHNSNTKEDIEVKINYTDSEKSKWINEILEYNNVSGASIFYF